jgi:hypothetical protein
MDRHEKLAARIFQVAALYGLAVLVPQYFLEGRIGRDFPPPITHPEHFYGFVGIALAWQLAFLLVAREPRRYRLFMLPAIAEKLAFGIAAPVLVLLGRAAAPVALFGGIDLFFAALFFVAFRATRGAERAPT